MEEYLQQQQTAITPSNTSKNYLNTPTVIGNRDRNLDFSGLAALQNG